MRLALIVLVSVALGACASGPDARVRLAAFNNAQDVLNVTAPGAADERRAIDAAMPAIRACDASYEAGMRALWAARPSEPAALSEVRRMDRQFSACLQPAGLAGHHEMQVEGRFLPMPEYVAQGFELGRQAAADRPASSGGLGDILGAMALGRAMQAPAPAAPMPVTCSSIRVGANTTTTCR